MQDIGQTPSGNGGLPPMPPKDGEMARPAKPTAKPKEQNWDLVKAPPKAPKEPEPQKPGPELAYKGNLREFTYDVKNQVRKDMGKRLSVSERAGVTKIFSQRGGKFMGTRKERNELKEYAKEQGWSALKTKRILWEARNLKGKTRAA